MTMRRLLSVASPIALLALLPPAIALAQVPAAGTQPAPDKAPPADGAVTEVVVTAQKRTEKLQDVPISIEVVSGAKLAEFHATDFKSIMNLTPNVFVESTAGNDTIYIRGFGSPPTNFSFDQSVSLYVDGIYAGRAHQVQAPFFDLQRVEVLRGPQGALFGKNTPAGAINIVSAGPSDHFEAAANAAYNFDLTGYDIDGYVSGPIAEGLSARLAVRFLDQDGYIRNQFTGHADPKDQQKLARLTVRYAPTSKFDYTVKLDYGDRNIVGGMNVSSPLDSAQDPRTYRYATSSDLGAEGVKTTSLTLSGTGNLALGDFTLTSVTGYSFYRSRINNDYDLNVPDSDQRTINSIYISFPEHFRQISQEVRLLSPVGRRFEYVVGGYYDQSLYQLTQTVGFVIPVLPPLPFPYAAENQSQFRQRTESYSLFGQGTYHVLDKLRLVGSLRYTDSEKRGLYSGALLSGPFSILALTSAVAKISEDHVDPSVTVQYDVLPKVMFYATYGKGSKSGGFVSNTFGTTSDTFAFRPEESENYEAGVKSTLFDGRMTLNVSVYDTSFSDLQVSIYNATRATFETSNAASASSKGVEAAATWYPTRNFDLTGSMAYQDAKYDDYPGAACLATQSTAQCDPSNPASVLANNIKGAPLPYSSKFTGNIQAHGRIDLPNASRLDATLSLSGRSKYFDSDDENPAFGVQKGYAKVDLRVQYAPDDQRWHVALVGRNLTNELTTGSAFGLAPPLSFAPRAILYLEQTRNISIEAGVKF